MSRSQPRAAKILPLTHAGLLFPLLECARRKGADLPRALRRAGLPVALRQHPASLVATRSWHQLYQNLADELGQSDLGWHVGFDGRLRGHSGEFTQGIFQAPTLLAALRFAAVNGTRECSTHRVRVQVHGDHAFVIHTNPDRTPGYEQRNVARLASIIRLVEAFHGPGWRPDLIVTETGIDVLPTKGELEKVPVIQRRDWSAVCFPRKYLAAAYPAPLISRHSFADAPAPDLRGQLKQLLRSYVLEEPPSIAEIAEMTLLSKRSLQRQLRALGSSYRALLQEVRFEAAREMLTDEQASITDVARALGYTDSAHFARFFRCVSGVSPKEFRRAQAAGGTVSH